MCGWDYDDRERAMDAAEEPEPDLIRDAIAEGWKSDPYLWGYEEEGSEDA